MKHLSKYIVLILMSSLSLQGISDDSMNLSVPAEGWHQEVKTGPLQKEIDKLSPNSVLRLKKGIHQGPIHIQTPGVTIEGEDGAVISGNGIGSIVVIEANDVTIKNLILKDSGMSYTQADSGIGLRKANNVKIINNKLEDCLFGIDVHSGDNILIEKNLITSKNLEVGMRGDAIRLWSVTNSKILNNDWRHSRDVVSWYSSHILFRKNQGSDSRYSIHAMYSKHLQIQDNHFSRNQVGIFLMYSENFVITNNTIERSLGATGMGIGLKESSNIFAQDNTITYSAVGILVDTSPFKRGSKNWFHRNRFSFNSKGVFLSNDLPGGEFKSNVFLGNLQDVDINQSRQSNSVWDKNQWDKYNGFDEDDNLVGDTPYIVRKYGDSINGGNPKSSFFYGTPLFTLVTIIEEVANFGEPTIVFIDNNPKIAE